MLPLKESMPELKSDFSSANGGGYIGGTAKPPASEPSMKCNTAL